MRVTLPMTRHWTSARKWAMEHCPSYTGNDWHQQGYNDYEQTMIDYFFDDEKDAIIFILRWT